MIIKYIEEIEIPYEDCYKFTMFFRYYSSPTFEMMDQALLLSSNYDEFKLLTYYYTNFEELQNLKYLWPILKITREITSECSFEVSRTEAKIKKMKELLFKFKNIF